MGFRQGLFYPAVEVPGSSRGHGHVCPKAAGSLDKGSGPGPEEPGRAGLSFLTLDDERPFLSLSFPVCALGPAPTSEGSGEESRGCRL